MANTARHMRGGSREHGRVLAIALGESGTRCKKAAAWIPELKDANRKRLRRIEGQIRGLQKMVEEDRYCAASSRRWPPCRRRCEEWRAT